MIIFLIWYYLTKSQLLFLNDSIQNHAENAAIATLAGTDFVWIGLHREKQWSDGSSSLFRHWALGQPDSGQEECVTTAMNKSGLWSDDNCSLSFPFICYKTSNVPLYFCSDSTVKHVIEM